MIFNNRVEAGKKLASELKAYAEKDTVVLAIPRGGVVVGYEVARLLEVALDIIVPRKIGAPMNPELAIGAVTEDGTIIVDRRLVEYMGVPESYIKEESERQRAEIRRRLRLYRGDYPYPNLKDRGVIIVDDGIATGATVKAALASVRKRGVKSVVVAIPVGPLSTIEELKEDADSVVCLSTPEPFYAIGQFYEDFDQVSDDEVIRLLKLSRSESEGHR